MERSLSWRFRRVCCLSSLRAQRLELSSAACRTLITTRPAERPSSRNLWVRMIFIYMMFWELSVCLSRLSIYLSCLFVYGIVLYNIKDDRNAKSCFGLLLQLWWIVTRSSHIFWTLTWVRGSIMDMMDSWHDDCDLWLNAVFAVVQSGCWTCC